jgi:hypothetical protein
MSTTTIQVGESRRGPTARSLPYTRTFNYYEPDSEGESVEFRLIYKGPLPPEQWDEHQGRPVGRAKDKHGLRKHFHPQLRELWQNDPALKHQAESWFLITTTPHNQVSFPGPGVRQIIPVMPHYPGAKKFIDHIADNHVRCNGNRFIPLISKAGGFSCALDILFLRRDAPGNLIANGGDIDNRIKVLLDGLRMPIDEKELGACVIDKDTEEPFYCLLEDDRLVSKLSVTTDRLITPRESNESENDVMLVIHVTMVNPELVFAGGRLV